MCAYWLGISAAMMLLQATYLLGEPEPHVFKPLLLSLVLSVMALSILSLMAWLTARTALYTLTNKRVVMRIGVVLTLTFNLPLRMLAGASLKTHSDGTGDIALKLAGDDHIALAEPVATCAPLGLAPPRTQFAVHS
jgi:lysylphosphatidylglycerol synthetase-like protein (DUF2156 family)